MKSQKELINEYERRFGVKTEDIHPDRTDFTILQDEVLANIHIYGRYDTTSAQANVEMSRRLKNTIISMDKTARSYSLALLVIGLVTIAIMIWQIILLGE